jgi:hypothetical protein
MAAEDETEHNKKKDGDHRNLRRFRTGLREANITHHHQFTEKIE